MFASRDHRKNKFLLYNNAEVFNFVTLFRIVLFFIND